MSAAPHDHAPITGVRVALLTVSDTRQEADDRSGALARTAIVNAGHVVADYRIVADEPDVMRPIVIDWIGREDCDAVVVNGGSGVSPRDRTFEALAPLLDRQLDGFGEIFRALSYEQVGSRAMLSRAVGGVASGTPLFLLPGSPRAVELALEKLILPELGHLLHELRR